MINNSHNYAKYLLKLQLSQPSLLGSDLNFPWDLSRYIWLCISFFQLLILLYTLILLCNEIKSYTSVIQLKICVFVELIYGFSEIWKLSKDVFTMSNLANKEIMARNLQHYMDSYGVDRKRWANDLILNIPHCQIG